MLRSKDIHFIYNNILESEFAFEDKDKAMHFFQVLRQQFRGWNASAWGSGEFKELEKEIMANIGSGKASQEKRGV